MASTQLATAKAEVTAVATAERAAATAASATTAATADDSSNLQLAPLHPKPRTRVSREFDLVLKLKSPNGVVEGAMLQV